MSRGFFAILGMLVAAGLIGGQAASRDSMATPVHLEAVPTGVWELRAIVYSDGDEAVPADPANYTIEFVPGERSITYRDGAPDPMGNPDGRIGLELDCNVGSADYLVDGSNLTIIRVISTGAGCLQPTLGEELADRLLTVISFSMERQELILDLSGGGQLSFVPRGEASPVAGNASASARGVSPGECWVEPRPLAELTTLLGQDETGSDSSPIEVTIPVPFGREADWETATEISETVSEYLACRNAGDVPRRAALLTDAGVQRLLGADAARMAGAAGEAALATPAVLSPRDRTRLAFVTDISILADGTAAALAVVSDPLTLPRGRQTWLFLFVREADRWRIDNVLDFSLPSTPGAGTPIP